MKEWLQKKKKGKIQMEGKRLLREREGEEIQATKRKEGKRIKYRYTHMDQ